MVVKFRLEMDYKIKLNAYNYKKKEKYEHYYIYYINKYPERTYDDAQRYSERRTKKDLDELNRELVSIREKLS